MNTTRVTPVLTRLIVVLVVLGAIGTFLTRPDSGDPMLITAHFERAGLNVRAGDDVRVRGLPVGTISSIEVDRRDFSARYVLAVERDVGVAADSMARLVPKTLFGDKYVELDPARPGGPRLRSGALIPRARTATATEIQQVLDRAVPVLSAIDAQRFSATLASLAAGLDGTGRDMARLAEGATAVFDELAARQDELALLFAHAPGVAATLADRAGDLDTAAERMAAVADVLAANEPALARFLAENAELAGQAGELLRAEDGRINRIIPDMLTVLDVITAQPGKVAELARAAPVFTEGLAAVTATGSFRSPIAYMVGLGLGSRLDAKGPLSEAEGGAGVGPDVYVHGLEIPDVVVGDPQGQESAGLAALLGNLAGGGQ